MHVMRFIVAMSLHLIGYGSARRMQVSRERRQNTRLALHSQLVTLVQFLELARPSSGWQSLGLQSSPRSQLAGATSTVARLVHQASSLRMSLPSWVPTERIDEISEPEAQLAFKNMQTVELELPASVANGPCMTRYLQTDVKAAQGQPPVLLVHGFDISCLEYRRLIPKLQAAGVEAYAPCIAGWGFTETESLKSVSPEAKRKQLLAFWKVVLGGRPAIWVGTSLGANIAFDCLLEQPSAVQKFIALDPAFYADPPPAVPEFVGKLLISNVISQPPVRESIAKQAYFVKEDQTEDAIRCGNLHLNRAAWEDDAVEWLLCDKYSTLPPQLHRLRDVDTLTLWGRQDEVIPAAQLGVWPLAKLLKAVPDSSFRWVENSGHTPHLEQPAFTAEAIAAFLRGEAVPGESDTADLVATAERFEAVKASASKLLEDIVERARAALKAVGDT